MKEALPVAIVADSFDPETTDQPFGRRWGGQLIQLSPEHLAALQSGQTLALDVQGEYVVFLQFSQSPLPRHD